VKGCAVMMVVLPDEKNTADQRALEFELWNTHKIPMVFCSLSDVPDTPTHQALQFAGSEVAVVYFRSGYMPEHYPSDKEWEGRRCLELSRAVKTPTMAHHLMGCKKIQQRLAMPGGVEKYLDAGDAKVVRQTIVGHYSMDVGDRDPVVVADALKKPSNYVLKPQREGGGNNIYDQAVRDSLQSFSDQELSAFILMDIIQADEHEATFMRNGKKFEATILSELGIYGVQVKHGSTVVTNTTSGYLMRSKTSTSRETGINAGFGMLDSLQLVG